MSCVTPITTNNNPPPRAEGSHPPGLPSGTALFLGQPLRFLLLSTSLDADRAIAKKQLTRHLPSSTRQHSRFCLSPASRKTMAGFAAQPDEGYSEDPLNALSASASFSFKNREDAVLALASVRSGEFPAWLTQHISNLSMSRKTGMSFARLLGWPHSPLMISLASILRAWY